MNLAAQSTRLLLVRDTARAEEQLRRIEDLAASGQREIQALLTELRPRSISEEGLPAALRRLAAEREARDGLHIAIEINCDPLPRTPALSPAESAALFAIAQEGLTNIARHSGADHAAVRLNLGHGGPCLEVEDHGAGFDVIQAAQRPGHFGLAGMAEEAREVGWKLAVESQPGRGTRIRATPAPPATAGKRSAGGGG
jgi:signal transduction histidine kinase